MRLQRALAQALLCPLLCAAAGGPAKRWGARIMGPGNLPRKAGAAAWRPVWLERSHRCGFNSTPRFSMFEGCRAGPSGSGAAMSACSTEALEWR